MRLVLTLMMMFSAGCIPPANALPKKEVRVICYGPTGFILDICGELLSAKYGLHVREKGLASAAALRTRRRDWEEAYRTTPHGQPVTLPAAGKRR